MRRANLQPWIYPRSARLPASKREFRFGSLAGIAISPRCVRFVPDNRAWTAGLAIPGFHLNLDISPAAAPVATRLSRSARVRACDSF